MRNFLSKYWVLVWLALPAFAAAAEQQPIKAVRMDTPPTIDGTINDDEWKSVPFLEGLHDSTTGSAYADGGRFWIGYDKQYVYFAARLQESEPDKIHATEYRTNVPLTGDDFVELDLDLSGSTATFNTFQINPQGATNIRISGGRASKREWLGEFLAKAHKTPNGWECEARIPWRAMDIPRGGRRDVRFNILRFVAKNQRSLAYTFVPTTQVGLTPTWSDVELPKPEVDHSIRLLPYTYAGYDPKTKGIFNSGLDLKTAITDQINMVGSINPDFRNIANSVLSLDFSRFERIANETRPFFQEGSQYANSQLFIPQRISSFDAGINTYGRFNDKTSFSVISTARFGKESDSAFTITQDPNPNTSLRVTATDQELPGQSNQAYLVRYSQNYGDYNVFLRNMGSRDTQFGFGQQNDALVQYTKNGLSIGSGYTTADAGFTPRLGFVQEVDLKGPFIFTDWARSFDKGSISDYDINYTITALDHMNGGFYRREAAYGGSFTLRNGLNFLYSADIANFEGSMDNLFTYQATFPRGNPYNQVSVRYDQGLQAGFPYKSVTGTAQWRPSKGLQFSLREQHVDYQGAADQTVFTTAYDLGNDRSVAGRMVRQNDKVNAYLAYQRTGNQGIEYFLILGDPNAQVYRNALALKAVVPFSIGKKK